MPNSDATIDTFQCIDLDRTIFNTNLFLERIYRVVEEEQPGIIDSILQNVKKASEKEDTFFALEYIRDTIGR